MLLVKVVMPRRCLSRSRGHSSLLTCLTGCESIDPPSVTTRKMKFRRDFAFVHIEEKVVSVVTLVAYYFGMTLRTLYLFSY